MPGPQCETTVEAAERSGKRERERASVRESEGERERGRERREAIKPPMSVAF
jgi:hypothetical protein